MDHKDIKYCTKYYDHDLGIRVVSFVVSLFMRLHDESIKIGLLTWLKMYSAVPIQKAVTAYFSSKQSLPFGFAEHYTYVYMSAYLYRPI